MSGGESGRLKSGASGKIGSTLEVRGAGDEDLADIGGGVADIARGLGWFEAVGDAPGEE
jgi:hypothetical protein